MTQPLNKYIQVMMMHRVVMNTEHRNLGGMLSKLYFKSNQNKSYKSCHNGRARLKSPGSIWGAPILVLTDRKYLPIVHKRWEFGRPG